MVAFKERLSPGIITLVMGGSHWNMDLLIGRAMILAVGVCLIALSSRQQDDGDSARSVSFGKTTADGSALSS